MGRTRCHTQDSFTARLCAFTEVSTAVLAPYAAEFEFKSYGHLDTKYRDLQLRGKLSLPSPALLHIHHALASVMHARGGAEPKGVLFPEDENEGTDGRMESGDIGWRGRVAAWKTSPPTIRPGSQLSTYTTSTTATTTSQATTTKV